ncbi:MAG: ATP-dependent sacrificial sulfur transferase LarE [Planctomycetes bacterium]|nr:ATP-dependent sacrificial sulfur transferase LarE [Planctomycetota bacterium]
MTPEPKTSRPLAPHDRLVRALAELPSCLVAFSGGVDSAVVAKAAQLALGARAIAVTGVSASLAAGELETAQRIARAIGIRHEIVATEEFADAEYLENRPNRCWHCKDELYQQLEALANRWECEWIANGANADDLSDFRPGMRAADEHRVRSPLAECGFDKRAVRQIAQHWELEVWNKPATPCLSSRVVYGLEITPEMLNRIDRAEQMLRELGLSNVRVRYHHDDLARLEVALDDLPLLSTGDVRRQVVERLRELGFRYVTIDLEGFRSGSFQQLVSAEELTRFGK